MGTAVLLSLQVLWLLLFVQPCRGMLLFPYPTVQGKQAPMGSLGSLWEASSQGQTTGERVPTAGPVSTAEQGRTQTRSAGLSTLLMSPFVTVQRGCRGEAGKRQHAMCRESGGEIQQ